MLLCRVQIPIFSWYYVKSVNKLHLLSGPFLFAIKWKKKIEGKESEANFEHNLKQTIPQSALSSYPMFVDEVLNKFESKLNLAWPSVLTNFIGLWMKSWIS